MKRLIVTLGVGCALIFNLAAAARTDQWKKVDEAIQKGLPKTAVEALEPIIQAALKDEAWGEAAKAIARKIVMEGHIQGNKPEEKITRMQREIEQAPKELKPILHALQAHWYWHYFQQNRWRFMRRTATAAEPGKDFTTWDLPRLFKEIDKEFTLTFTASDVLKKLKVGQFDDLLQKGTVPDAYRPTMYDFIAHQALQFYTSGEQAAAKPEDAFEMAAASPILDPVASFLKWKPETTDQMAPKLQAILIFQDLLKFHQNDQGPSAFIDADIGRLQFGYNAAFGDEKATRYKAALKGLVDKWPDHELSATALHLWAQVVRDEGELVEARKLAERGAKVFSDSIGGQMCRNLVLAIESKELQISTERIWNKPQPKVSVNYRNLTEVYFRAVPWDWEKLMQRRWYFQEYLEAADQRELLNRQPAFEWSAQLPPTPDYQLRVENLTAPEDLKPGFYYIVASHKKDFSERSNQVVYTAVWISDLALVVRTRNGLGEGFVLEANSGEPVADAEIRSWHYDRNGNRVENAKVQTDEQGFYVLDAKGQQNVVVLARHKGREVSAMDGHYVYPPGKRDPYNQVVFFTDRSLYRPGQTINYKGICVAVDANKNNYELLPGQSLTVIFADPNGKEIARQEQRCNDYGSFTGSFTAPRDRVTGRMRLHAKEKFNGDTYFNVEEYKRPKFQVTLDAPKVAARLDYQVSLQGKAESYTGAAVDGAMVKYRVVREVRYPYWWRWCCWWNPYPSGGSQEIAHGAAKTAGDGTFKVEFTAKPDVSVSPTNEPTFYFTVHADVTDTTGETRSAQRGVHVGYTALQANMTANEWQTDAQPVEINLTTATLDGEGQMAEGSVKIHKLKEPAQVIRPVLSGYDYYRRYGKTAVKPVPTSDPNSWELAEVVQEKGFTTDKEGKLKLRFFLPSGLYRVLLETQDRFGKKVTARLPLQVLKPDANKLTLKIPHLFTAPKWTLEPGDEFMALWGTGYEQGRAFVEIEQRNKMLKRYWTTPGNTQEQIKLAVEESLRGGFNLHLTRVRENRAYTDSRRIEVPWSNKELEIKWEHFVSKLQPAQKETWTAIVTGPKAQKAVVEMVAALYDESLDAYLKHHWLQRFGFFYRDYSSLQAHFENNWKYLNYLKGNWDVGYIPVDRRYRDFPYDLVANYFGYGWGGVEGQRAYYARARGAEQNAPGAMLNGAAQTASRAASPALDGVEEKAKGERMDRDALGKPAGGAAVSVAPDLSQVSARKNLNETAFFFPQLISDKEGMVRMEFTMPEALTTWRFFGFAHDKELRSGFFQDKAVTAKDLMVQPNPPRFLREGDVLEFTVKVSNQTATRQQGKVALALREAATDKSVDKLLGNSKNELAFDIPAKESRSFSWRLQVPDDLGFLVYKAVGSSGRVSDGEEGHLPVLSRRVYVTESLPLPIRGPTTKKFEFTKLLQSGKSGTLKHQAVTVQMVSQPAWYAVMALPYLMEYPYECSEQIFNRLYANALARFIANSDPKIKRIFEQWRNTPALESPLEKNQDLKSVLLEETPWWRDAQNESQARRNVGILFEDNRLNYEQGRTLQKLTEMQISDGLWPWFPGGRGNEYITLYITTGFGRLRHLGVDIKVDPALKSLQRLDTWMDERYRFIMSGPHPELYVPSSLDALYLYGRSFFLKDKPIAKEHQTAIEFFLQQSRKFWLKLANRQSQAHLAIAHKRWGGDENLATAKDILKSIKERSVTNEELGMFWRDLELSWWWYHAPIETQAMMIEAFDEVMGDAQAVEECRVWLLKQKQTQNWKTTKATADAVYGLLLRGATMLASDALVEVQVAGQAIKPETVEAGTGFYEKRFAGPEVKAKFGEITVKKVDQGVSWGSIHWQYLEDMTKVTPYSGTPLKLKKTLYTKTNTKKGPVLEPVKGPIAVGDELVVRIELRVDRDMEYVHLKDQRGSGTEPVNVISRYRYQDGLAYYESTRDTASHFFIDYLPKGVYVFEYSTRVQHRGQYQTGLASIQCMYAPEFNSHSESFNLVVK